MKQLDVTDEASVQTCIAETIKEFGGIDVLVNNAGFGTRKNVEQVRASASNTGSLQQMGMTACMQQRGLCGSSPLMQ